MCAGSGGMVERMASLKLEWWVRNGGNVDEFLAMVLKDVDKT